MKPIAWLPVIKSRSMKLFGFSASRDNMTHQFSTSCIEDATSLFRHYRRLAEAAMEQVADEQLFATLDPEMNSIAVIVKHMGGNMRSRWTDFLGSDGEKPDRNRDTEFVDPPRTRSEVMALWDRGWDQLFRTLA